mmetsp:Transcript_28215/g.76164  ORF Transcript_28215/g.76164 Transcript_28215/m.76164 type:complete len:126 (-) Transcript_28215:1952-2329(-)
MAGFLRGTAGARVLSPTAPVTLFPTSNRSIAAWLKPSNCASQGVKPHIATVTANIGGKSIQMQAPPSPQGFLLGMGEDEPFFSQHSPYRSTRAALEQRFETGREHLALLPWCPSSLSPRACHPAT